MPQFRKKQDQGLSPQPSLMWDYYLHYSHFCARYRHGDSHLTCSKPPKERMWWVSCSLHAMKFSPSLFFQKVIIKFDF